MRTRNPISTVSFNTENFLSSRLQALVSCGKLSFWCYIKHNPEPEGDECGKKFHFHVYCEPSILVQTDDIRKQFVELDENNIKPLGTLLWTTSKFDDWFLYALHDPFYLASKGLKKKFQYTDVNFKTSSEEDLQYKVHMINRISLMPYEPMINAIKTGVTWQQYFNRGHIPIQQIALYEKAWNCLDAMYRPIAPSHVRVDKDGVVLDGVYLDKLIIRQESDLLDDFPF